MPNLRKARQGDARLLFEWINEPEARATAVNPKPILWDEHLAWFSRKLSDDSTYLYILTDSKQNMGVIRFDKSPEGYVISYSVDKDHRGKGLGTFILKKGMEKLGKIVKNPIFIGYVKKGNIPSEKIFGRLSFSVKSKKNIQGVDFIIYQK